MLLNCFVITTTAPIKSLQETSQKMWLGTAAWSEPSDVITDVLCRETAPNALRNI